MTFVVPQWQMDELAAQQRRAFIAHMADYAAAHQAALVSSLGEPLRTWLGHALARAHALGVTLEPDVARLMLLWMRLGIDVDEREPWAHEALHAKHLAGIGKVRALIRAAQRHDHEIPAFIAEDDRW